MKYRGSAINQDLLLRLLASYELAAADYETVRRLLRQGAIEENGPLMLDLEVFRNGPPPPMVTTRPEHCATLSARARRAIALECALAGGDVGTLRAAGLAKAARRKRRANLGAYWKLVGELDQDVRATIARELDAFTRMQDWSGSAELFGRAARAHLGVFRLRAAALLYALRLPGAASGIAPALTAVQPLLDPGSTG